MARTRAVFVPFDLFGSEGASAGAQLLADAFREMLDDNRRERVPTRARAYAGKVRLDELSFQTTQDYQGWRQRLRRTARAVLKKGDFLLWASGNHLGVLPVYEELGRHHTDTLVVQWDAHLDIYNLSDCTTKLSHGNFLLHSEEPLPTIINVGHRELLLRPEHVHKYYLHTFPAGDLAVDPEPALTLVRQECGKARRVFLDLDCDVFDPAYFPALAHPAPFGLTPHLFLRFLDAAWSERVVGLAVSEFYPARDQDDRCLSTLIWLLEYVLLKCYEAAPHG
jgi:arginase family enzyme